MDFLIRFGLNFHPMGELQGGWGLIGPATNFFCLRQKRDYLSRASQRARGATKKKFRLYSFLYTAAGCSDECCTVANGFSYCQLLWSVLCGSTFCALTFRCALMTSVMNAGVWKVGVVLAVK